MTADTLTVFVILAVTIVLLMSERLRLDLVALLALLALLRGSSRSERLAVVAAG